MRKRNAFFYCVAAAFIIPVASMLAGCPVTTTRDTAVMAQTQTVPNTTEQAPAYTGAWRVERVAVFHDDLAYGEHRGIYEITNTETGQHFVGISGVGVAEVGSHTQGKSLAEDER